MESDTHGLASPQSMWPYTTYAYKPFEVPIHPAFIPLPYRTIPVHYPQLGMGACPFRSKSQSFTIEAILNKNKSDRTMYEELACDIHPHKPSNVNTSGCHTGRHVLETAHPYLTIANDDSNRLTADKKQTEPYSREQKKQNGTNDWKHVKGKRVRTIFTPEQLERLEAEFERQQYMVGTERYYLASALNLTEAQVKVWFQNRRIKWRKHNLEQQQAKMAKLGLYHHLGSDSDSDTGDEIPEQIVHKDMQALDNTVDPHTSNRLR